MIVADCGDSYQFVTQPDHADLAGQFADHWGGEGFDRPEPFAPLALAAYAHDTGWEAYDRHPRLDAEGAPVDFRDMPADTWVALYEDGIDAVAEMDTYAGLLVSLHGAGLRNQRYGLSPEWPETPPDFRAFVAREEDRQSRLLEEAVAEGLLSEADEAVLATLHESGPLPGEAGGHSDGGDGRLWADYRRLQAWDALSLSFCITDSPPGYASVGAVPTADGGDAALSVTAAGESEFRIDPYPFDTAGLTVTVPTRTVPKSAFDDEASLVRAYYGVPRETRTFRLHPSD